MGEDFIRVGWPFGRHDLPAQRRTTLPFRDAVYRQGCVIEAVFLFALQFRRWSFDALSEQGSSRSVSMQPSRHIQKSIVARNMVAPEFQAICGVSGDDSVYGNLRPKTPSQK